MDPSRTPYSLLAVLRGYFVVALMIVMLGVPMASAQAKDTAPAKGSEQSVSLDQLANIIENDKSREQLVKELRQAAAAQNKKKQSRHLSKAQKKTAAAAKKPAPVSRERLSFARHFARVTSGWAETIGARFTHAWHVVTSLFEHKKGARKRYFNYQAFFNAAMTFVLIAASTVVAFFILRALAAFVFAAIGRFAARSRPGLAGFVCRGGAVAAGIGIDVVLVLLACNAGYLAGLYAFGESGSVGTRASLFINAFALIELIKVGIRALFAARYDSLRLLQIPAEIAAWWSIRLRWFVGVIGYALLVAVPIVNGQLSYVLGAVLTFLIMGGAYIYALKVIFGNHKLLTQRLMHMADNASIEFFSVLYRLFARLWLVLAVAYFTTLFVVSQSNPATALPFMLSATLQTLVVAAIGFAISGLLSRTIGRRVRFSDSLRDKLPMLEGRVNSYVPNALQVVRVVILALVAAAIANAWHIFNFGAWLTSGAGLTVITIAVKVAIILVAAALLWLISASVIEHRLSPNTGHGAPTARQQTLLVLFRNVLAILIAAFTVMIALSQIGVNIGPLIAGAGVFGLAIGFGAQTLVHDIISGVFIQLENAINTGDVVTAGGVTGTAERLTIRSVSIRDIDGAYHIVPFSSSSIVTNYMRDWSYFRTEYGIAYREDIDNAIYYLREAFADLKSNPTAGPNILEDMTVPGVTALADSAVNIRIMIKTKPGTQWGVGRAFNRLVKIHFDRAGIELPFPHRTLYFGEDREGHAPPANLRVLTHDDADEAPAKLKKRRRGDDAAPEETGDAPPS